MGRTDEEPSPRSSVQQIDQWRPRSSARVPLPIGVPVEKSFVDVIDERRSIRHLVPPAIDRLATLLWHAARTRGTAIRSDGLPWQHRAAPSAGGLHPIELFVVPAVDTELLRYDPIVHALDKIDDIDHARLEGGRARLVAAVDGAAGTCVVLAADFSRTEQVYEHAESLVWRDAGALLATLQLTATAMDLGFCLLGLLGDDVIASMLGPPTLRGVGAAIVGERR